MGLQIKMDAAAFAYAFLVSDSFTVDLTASPNKLEIVLTNSVSTYGSLVEGLNCFQLNKDLKQALAEDEDLLDEYPGIATALKSMYQKAHGEAKAGVKAPVFHSGGPVSAPPDVEFGNGLPTATYKAVMSVPVKQGSSPSGTTKAMLEGFSTPWGFSITAAEFSDVEPENLHVQLKHTKTGLKCSYVLSDNRVPILRAIIAANPVFGYYGPVFQPFHAWLFGRCRELLLNAMVTSPGTSTKITPGEKATVGFDLSTDYAVTNITGSADGTKLHLRHLPTGASTQYVVPYDKAFVSALSSAPPKAGQYRKAFPHIWEALSPLLIGFLDAVVQMSPYPSTAKAPSVETMIAKGFAIPEPLVVVQSYSDGSKLKLQLANTETGVISVFAIPDPMVPHLAKVVDKTPWPAVGAYKQAFPTLWGAIYDAMISSPVAQNTAAASHNAWQLPLPPNFDPGDLIFGATNAKPSGGSKAEKAKAAAKKGKAQPKPTPAPKPKAPVIGGVEISKEMSEYIFHKIHGQQEESSPSPVPQAKDVKFVNVPETITEDPDAEKVHLREAVALYQPVFGTDPGSTYRVIALGDKVKIAFRLKKNQGMAFRVEFNAKALTNFEKSTLQQRLIDMGVKNGGGSHWSVHVEHSNSDLMRRFVGGALYSLISFTRSPLPDFDRFMEEMSE